MSRRAPPGLLPEAPSSPASSAVSVPVQRPGLRPAGGGGRRGGAGEPVPAATPARELWLAVHLPHCVLESLQVAAELQAGEAPPVAVVDLEDGGRVVRDRDARAAAAGVEAGMALNSALALEPALRVLSREPRRERRLLEAVARLAREFTPRVSLEPPDAVLLEVRGSLRLFGGARPLMDRLRARLRSQGLAPRLALTPTPLAALWFARVGQEVVLRRIDALPARLAPLPLGCTRWPGRVIESLVTMGVVTVGECWRLPRDGFARRFGPRLRLELDRAAGRLPEPRATHVAPARYHARHELEPELADAGRLLNAAVPLLEELCGFLRERGAGVESLELRLVHRESPDTRLRLRFAGPVDRAPRIATLLGERLAQVALPEPVRRLQLRSGPLVRVAEEAGDLFARGRPQSAAVPQLVERLRARLGPSAVHGLRLVPGHRPEAVQENGDIPLFSPPAIAGAGRYAETRECFPSRPTWLLAEPQALGQGTPPCCEGPLEIEAGPERIESGWWDGRDVRRDYYVARNPAGVRLWIFRGRGADEGWYLHGVFG